jgi:hypothetical protein
MTADDQIGLASVDRLEGLTAPALKDYLKAASQYVRESASIDAGPKKKAQIRLSRTLGEVLLGELSRSIPRLADSGKATETKVAGALRTAQADVSESHRLDGLRLAVEIKPVNLAVGRAIWNRFGDIRTFAVNIHLKFPFAVVGGLLAIPSYEEVGSGRKKSTLPVIERAVERLRRAGGRENEAAAPHLLEAIGVIVYDPDTSTLDETIPPPNCGLRWSEFVNELSDTYLARFED